MIHTTANLVEYQTVDYERWSCSGNIFYWFYKNDLKPLLMPMFLLWFHQWLSCDFPRPHYSHHHQYERMYRSASAQTVSKRREKAGSQHPRSQSRKYFVYDDEEDYYDCNDHQNLYFSPSKRHQLALLQ